MPTTPLKNTLYRLALPLLAPSPRGRDNMHHSIHGDALVDMRG